MLLMLPLVDFVINHKEIFSLIDKAGKFIENQASKLSISERITIISQIGYLDSFQEVAKLSNHLDLLQAKKGNISSELKGKIEDLKTKDFKVIDDREIKDILSNFHVSQLAEDYNKIFTLWLKEKGFEESQAEIFTQRIAINTNKHLFAKRFNNGEIIQPLIDKSGLNIQAIDEKYDEINSYLETQIQPLPQETIFKEKFTLQEIYVSLEATPLDANGKEIKGKKAFILEDKVMEMLLDSNQKDRVIFIQGGPGRGKSVFCKMIAHRVRRELHPILIPILIKLRDIIDFDRGFEQILTNTLNNWGFTTDSRWLTDNNTQYLFILDGFDELRMEGRVNGGIENFIKQVGIFQEKFQKSQTGHRVIITGRPLALQGISYLPSNLERMKLEIMNDHLQEEWLANWQRVVDVDSNIAEEKTQAFRAFLRADNCPKEVKEELAREPLLLYLLAAMHRDGEIRQEDFDDLGDSQAKISIYEKSLDWVLKEQRGELSAEVVGLEQDEFDFGIHRILTEAGLCVVQSGGEYAKVNTIETRLKEGDSSGAEIIQQIRAKKGEKALRNALCAFYLKPAAGDKGGAVEFYHKSFSEFLCAKRLKDAMEEWTESKPKRKIFIVDNDSFAKEIYDLLGYGALTGEIVEYLMGLLKQSSEFKPIALFKRLEDFYYRWADGEFIDDEDKMLPMWKMKQLKRQSPAKEKYLGVRQVDVYTGLNVMILLLELSHYDKSKEDSDLEEDLELKERLVFYPCGKPDDNGNLEDRDLLLRLIGYSDCVGVFGFLNIVGNFLTLANLTHANLFDANLEYANLFDANLIDANLTHANLTHANLTLANLTLANLTHANLFDANLTHANLFDANLTLANLTHANLFDANLSHANLTLANLTDANLFDANLSHANLTLANLFNANLSHANLEYANLTDANLFNANLSHANLEYADLKDIIWNEETNWNNVKGLETVKNIPQELKQQLGLD